MMDDAEQTLRRLESQLAEIDKRSRTVEAGLRLVVQRTRVLAEDQLSQKLELATAVGIALGDICKVADLDVNGLILVLEKHYSLRAENRRETDLLLVQSLLASLRLRAP